MTLTTLCKEAHDNAILKGFYKQERKIDGLIMLIVTELAEAVEADRNEATYHLSRYKKPEVLING